MKMVPVFGEVETRHALSLSRGTICPRKQCQTEEVSCLAFRIDRNTYFLFVCLIQK